MEEALKRILNGNVTNVSACETSTRPTSAVQSAFEQPKVRFQTNKLLKPQEVCARTPHSREDTGCVLLSGMSLQTDKICIILAARVCEITGEACTMYIGACYEG